MIAEELTPSRFLELDSSRAVAVATFSGSPASHVAMLARAHAVPMLVQLGCAPGDLQPGVEAVVDADRGCLVPAPAPSTRDRYALRIEERRAREREVARNASRPVHTREGTPIQVLVNVDDPSRLAGIEASFCDGIGLTRTEFLFHRAAGLPGEETQLDCYRRLVAWADGRPVTVRTLDAGGDKPIPGLTIEGESNPLSRAPGRAALPRPSGGPRGTAPGARPGGGRRRGEGDAAHGDEAGRARGSPPASGRRGAGVAGSRHGGGDAPARNHDRGARRGR